MAIVQKSTKQVGVSFPGCSSVHVSILGQDTEPSSGCECVRMLDRTNVCAVETCCTLSAQGE